jgi:hypothetical protein
VDKYSSQNRRKYKIYKSSGTKVIEQSKGNKRCGLSKRNRFSKQMKELVTKLLSSNDGVSSKRLNSIYGLFLFTGALIAVVSGDPVQDSIFYSLVAIILGNQGLTMINKPLTNGEQQTTKTVEVKTDIKPDKENEDRNESN